MKIDKIKKNSTQDIIIKKIESMILNKKFKEGERLPSQDELAESFGVSRTTLREALNSLKIMGLIDIKHGDGTYVKKFESSKFLESVSTFLKINQKNILEVMEVRKFLEVTTVRLATLRADEDDIENIKNKLEQMKRNKGKYKQNSYELFSKDDMEFHIAIAEATKNHIFKQIINSIQDNMKIEQLSFIQTLDDVEEIIEQHEKIFKEIKNRNAEKSTAEMSNHIKTIEKVIKEAISKQDK